jgi:metal-responsive CopG/Arc/MetJ family transcriptional regulator
MSGQETSLTRKRGPKPTGQGHVVGVRLQPNLLSALDAWIAEHDSTLSRAEAVRMILRRELE